MLKQGVALLSMVAYLLPIVATVLGIVVLHEKVGLSFFLAAALILGGVVLVNRSTKPDVMNRTPAYSSK